MSRIVRFAIIGGALAAFAFGTAGSRAADPVPAGDEMVMFIRRVLGATEDGWKAIFAEVKATYDLPKLVVFSAATRTACGLGTAAVGPFYCNFDRKIYLDLAFFEELKRMGAPGDMAQAYVIMHETGHHVQNLLGIAAKIAEYEKTLDEKGRNALSVRVELQADCFAGVLTGWMEKKLAVIEPGDMEKVLAATRALGDDTLDKLSTGQVMPDSFTHGSAEQRWKWFSVGRAGGKPGVCDTFRMPHGEL